jgi:hypothetical protein
MRIQKLRDFRKLFADTAITTTHFLKKCIKVPRYMHKNKDDTIDYDEALSTFRYN